MVWTVVVNEDISESSSLSSSSKDLLEELVDMIDGRCVCENGGCEVCEDDEVEVIRGLVGRIGSLMGGANVLIKDDETSERRDDIFLEPLEKLNDNFSDCYLVRTRILTHPLSVSPPISCSAG
jgi:hypothetical protein